MSICNICPRGCRVPRRESVHGQGAVGYCRTGMLPIVSRAALHHWEEPCISGTRGAGTVFFAGCNLSCVYCQNYEISELRRGIEISVERLAEIYRELIAGGGAQYRPCDADPFHPCRFSKSERTASRSGGVQLRRL
ncbi:4Fe-4S cluster-binding domain-containing protein [Dialister invisus]|uniref:4Fe-4S cluster-binding domain-containing protein n=1 Tax=Dialister invisus TaxID=218538 RepID=UPI003C6D1B09